MAHRLGGPPVFDQHLGRVQAEDVIVGGLLQRSQHRRHHFVGHAAIVGAGRVEMLPAA